MYKLILNFFFLVALWCGESVVSRAQFNDCTSGLLQMPTAEMYESGTFTITGNFLNHHATSEWRWPYHTFGYGVSITIFSRIEIAYSMTIIDGKRMPNPTDRDLIMINQDRHFAAKFLLLREGDFFSWMPALAVGFSDPISATDYGYKYAAEHSSGYFHRIYLALSKHFGTNWGDLSVHAGYQYNPNVAKLYHYNGPCAAIKWNPVWLKNRWFNPFFILEYDARTLNLGFISSIYDDHFQAMFELQAFKWISFGLRYKLLLRS